MSHATPTAAEVLEALLHYVDTGTCAYGYAGSHERLGVEQKVQLYRNSPSKLVHGIWLIDAIHRMQNPAAFSAKFEAILKLVPRGLNQSTIRQHLTDTLLCTAVVDNREQARHLEAVWELINANPKSVFTFNLNRLAFMDIHRLALEYDGMRLSGAPNTCYLAYAVLQFSPDASEQWSFTPGIKQEEAAFLKGLFEEGQEQAAKRTLCSKITFLRKHYSPVTARLAQAYAQYLTLNVIEGEGASAINLHLIKLLFEAQQVEHLYQAFVQKLAPGPLAFHGAEKYQAILVQAQQVFQVVMKAVRPSQHDEMLALQISRQFDVKMMQGSAPRLLANYFRWVASIAHNWPVVVTALLTNRGTGLELQRAQKATAGTACRLAMSYLINPRDVTPRPTEVYKTLAEVVVQDTYTLKLAGLVLHNRKDRNKAIEALYAITQDARLLEMMHDSSLVNTLATELGL
ncbi:hypothetical protein RBE51_20845 [Pseudomonas taiwanensis]|uniref:hypothetical protein n=1 Tax=Pseudomonas taiwanensis TaxID=470150 RepID=UPI0028DF9007|nr:hypothetical protein [Pseudomonas taiwanensis]MDT8925245.1 hypothetical protein [Pseudomonas taiwanensis]